MHGSAPSGNATRSGAGLSRKQLGDFTTDRRVLALIAMAFVVGTGGAFAALFLMKLIAFVANPVWFGKISTAVVAMGAVPRTPWMVVAPVLGGLTVGLMAVSGRRRFAGMAFPRRSRRS
jgi:chloride channel protein, CIC family